jgi:hypothetical protein
MKRVTGGSIPIRVWRDVMVAAQNSGKGRNLAASSLPASYSPYSPSAPSGTSLGDSDDFGGLLQRLLSAENTPSPQAAAASDPSAMTLLSAPVSARPDDDSSKSWKLND